MRHLQTYELTKQEHKSLAEHPFLLVLPASPHPQEITLSVAGVRRRAVSATLSPDGSEEKETGSNGKAKKVFRCWKCKATTNAHGDPITNQHGLSMHLYRKHGIKKAKAKGGDA